jgi:hypothetical protein
MTDPLTITLIALGAGGLVAGVWGVLMKRQNDRLIKAVTERSVAKVKAEIEQAQADAKATPKRTASATYPPEIYTASAATPRPARRYTAGNIVNLAHSGSIYGFSDVTLGTHDLNEWTSEEFERAIQGWNDQLLAGINHPRPSFFDMSVLKTAFMKNLWFGSHVPREIFIVDTGAPRPSASALLKSALRPTRHG